ncbi:MAG: copper resistance protein CopC [Actinomycetota bacterium]
MTVRRRIAAALLLAGAGLLFIAPRARPHPLLQSSDPTDGAELTSPPDAVTLTFTEDPEVALSVVRVLDSSGAEFQLGKPVRVPSMVRTLRVRVRDLPEGVYTVAWRVVSRVDGHATGGAFAFGVGVSPANATPNRITAPVTPPISPAEVAGRWLLYLGLLGLVGGAWTSALAFPVAPARPRRFMMASWAVSLGGLILFGLSQRAAAGVGFGDLASTPIGHALIWRAVAIIVAGLALVLAARSAGRRARIGLVIVGVAAAGGVFAHVDAGHAAASEPAWRNIASQFVHVLAAGVWIGGLAALLLGIRGAPSDDKARAVRRFSAAAGFAILVVAITGTVRAIAEIGSWDGLFSSTYGRLVIAKIALIAGLAALGAINRYRNVPSAGSDVSGLRRVSRAELALAGLALAAAAGLASASPPADAPASAVAADRIVVVATDFAQTIRVRLEVTPGFAGPNAFVAHATVPDTGEPLDATRVALRFRFVDASVGETELELTRIKRGVYAGNGSNLSLDGPWTVTVIIQQPTDSFEILIELETRCRAEALPVSGGPTLYNIRLPAGSAQLYVDPGTAGLNEVHVTFFDAAGQELPVAALPTIFGTHGGERIEFEVRRFGSGHFVADATLDAGGWRFEFVQVFDGGGSVQAVRGCFEETIR